MADDWDPFADPAGVDEPAASEVRKPAAATAATTNGHSKKREAFFEEAPPPPEPWELTQEEEVPPTITSAPSKPPPVRPEAEVEREGEKPEFLPAREFAGNKLGYVFTTGQHGTGYYLERALGVAAAPPPQRPTHSPLAARREAEQLPPPPKDTCLAVVAPTSLPDPEEKEALLDEQQKEEIREEVKKLKLAKNVAVENEEFEEAAALKRRIKVLEDTLGEAVKYEQAKASRTEALAAREKPDPKPKGAAQKPPSQLEHGEALWQMPSDTMKLCPEEREFLQASKMATMRKGVTDDTVNGVPQWAYKDALKDGVKGVKTERPSELQYIFKGQIEDEKWEDGANFQTSVVVQCDVESAFSYCCAPNMGRSEDEEEPNKVQVGPGAHIHHHQSGTAQLSEMMGSEIVENETVVFKVVVVKPKVKGKVKLEAARTVTTREPFQKQPFYSFKSVWRFAAYPAGGTRVVRVVRDFKQFELLEFDALKAVSRSIELENEGLRQSWSSTIAAVPDRGALAKRGGGGQHYERPEPTGTLARRTAVDGEMYSASFVVEAAADRVFNTVVSNEILLEYKKFVNEDSYVQLDESHALIRQLNGIVLLVTSRVKAEHRQWMTMTVAHMAGNSFDDAKHVTTQQEVIKDPFYRVVEDWLFLEQKEGETTLVKRTMRDFTQTGAFHVSDLPTVVAESADAENKALIETFRKIRLKEGLGVPNRPADQAISTRANYAMRQMPEILDHAAKNNVLEVREMLEVKGADPNYIHVRRDSWAVSDSRLEFYEEITPLIVAAEHGACEVIKVLFNHPQIDVNLCCCAFNDVEIYNFYTAYDMTISKKHPHAAALLRARGVLPASSEHVYKPSFDRIHGRPIRETVNQVYEEDDYGFGEMPSWEVVSQGNPRLAEALHQVADTLSMTRSQSSAHKGKIFKGLITDWHPDRHASTGEADIATKVFQWLQVVKQWYMEENGGPATDQQPLPGYDDPDRPVAPAGAQQYLHPSGSVFSVW